MSAHAPVSFRVLILGFAACLAAAAAGAATVHHVSGTTGADDRDGLTPESAVATIQEAARRAGPGDRIVVARGVYYGPIELDLRGTAERPITLEAEDRSRGAVIITNANRALREGEVAWERVDAETGLYRAPLRAATCRVLYSGVDLQPYASLEGLGAFTTEGGLPGPAHGYYHDAEGGWLYVRLHASGRYGDTDPARHVVSAGTRTGAGHAGTGYNGPTFFNLGLMARGDLHVVVDGFTFETPGFSGVHVNGSQVTVRHAWFLGCRAGVTGRRESRDPAMTSNHVTVEYCDYTQYPAFDDMQEVVWHRRPAAGAPRYPLYWWSRKGGKGVSTYETGICGLVGSDWTVRHNRVHNAFEGLSTWSLRWSKRLDIHDNVFERLVDNAIELEDHAEDMRIRRNLIVDVVEPLSWQPLGGAPWPGPAYIYENVIVSDGAMNRLIEAASGHSPGWFKAGASQQNWTAAWNEAHMRDVPRDAVRAPGAGIVVFNNTVIFPGGRFLNRVQPRDRRFENFHFVNNVIVARSFGQHGEAYEGANMAFRNNVWMDDSASADGSGGWFAGEGGVVLERPPSDDWTPEGLLAAEGAGLRGRGVPVPEAAALGGEWAEAVPHIGAIAHGDTWTRPVVGPQPREVSP